MSEQSIHQEDGTNEYNTQQEQKQNQPTAGLSTNRIEAFSDGVFAIALTLLVLEIKLPEISAIHTDQQLQDFLFSQGPTYLSYVLSVLVIGIFWVAHHGLFHYIRRADRNLFWLNILFLLTVTFIPFPTALLGTFSNYHTAVVIYGASLALTGILLDIMRWYATSKHRLVDPHLDAHLIRTAMRRNLTGPVIYLLAIAISFLPWHLMGINSVQVCIALYILVPLLYILPGRIDAYWAERKPGKRTLLN